MPQQDGYGGVLNGKNRMNSVEPDSAMLSFAPKYSCFIKLFVHSRNLFHPFPSVTMLQAHDVVVTPVKVIGDKGYLLIHLFEGVAYNPPIEGRSTSKTC